MQGLVIPAIFDHLLKPFSVCGVGFGSENLCATGAYFGPRCCRQHRVRKKRKLAKEATETKPSTTMATISTVVLFEEEVVVEVELEGDVATGPIGLEEIPVVPTTSVVLVGVVSGDRVAVLVSDVVLVGVV